MSGVIATIPKFQFSSSTGAPLANGTLTVYVAGSTTPTNTWQDQALTSLNTNPVALDSRGECVLWLDSAVNYKFLLKNAAGAIQWTQDNISGSISASSFAASSGASLVGYMPAGTGAVATTVQAKLREDYLLADCINLEAYRSLVVDVGGEDRWDAAFSAAQTEALLVKKPIYLGANPVIKYFTTTWDLSANDSSKDGLAIFGAGIRWSKPYFRNTSGACVEVQGVDRIHLKGFQIAGDCDVGIAGGRATVRQWNGRQFLENIAIIMPDDMTANSGIGTIAYLGIEPEESTYDCCEFWANLPVFLGPPNNISVRTFTTAGALTTTRTMTWTPAYTPILGTLLSNTVYHFTGGCRMVAHQPDSPPIVLRSASSVDLGGSFLQIKGGGANPAKEMKKCPFAVDASNIWNLKWFGTAERATDDVLTDVGALLIDGTAQNLTVSANAGTANSATLNLVPAVYVIDSVGTWNNNDISLRLNSFEGQYPLGFSNTTGASLNIQNSRLSIGSTASISTIPQQFMFNMSTSEIRLKGASSVAPVILEKPSRYKQKLIIGKDLAAAGVATTVATVVLPISNISAGTAQFKNVALTAGYITGAAQNALLSGEFDISWIRNAATAGLTVTVTRASWSTSVKTSAGSLDIAAPTITALLSGQASFQIQIASNLSGTGTAGITTRMDADITVSASYGVNSTTAQVTTQ